MRKKITEIEDPKMLIFCIVSCIMVLALAFYRFSTFGDLLPAPVKRFSVVFALFGAVYIGLCVFQLIRLLKGRKK